MRGGPRVVGAGEKAPTWPKLRLGITIPFHMSREIRIGDRRFYVVSEPDGNEWKAQVLELDEAGSTQAVGIETTGETQSLADDRAVGILQRRFRDASSIPE